MIFSKDFTFILDKNFEKKDERSIKIIILFSMIILNCKNAIKSDRTKSMNHAFLISHFWFFFYQIFIELKNNSKFQK